MLNNCTQQIANTMTLAIPAECDNFCLVTVRWTVTEAVKVHPEYTYFCIQRDLENLHNKVYFFSVPFISRIPFSTPRISYIYESPSQYISIYLLLVSLFLVMTPTSVISTVLASISCRARTERDCSRTKEHMARSGGTFCKCINNREVN